MHKHLYKRHVIVPLSVEDILKVRTRFTSFDHLWSRFRETIHDMTEKKKRRRRKQTKQNKETMIMACLHLDAF